MFALEVHEINRIAREHGGKAYLVGGFVRDFAMDITPSDYDIEVYGIEPDKLFQILAHFEPELVGASFGIMKIGTDIDVSIPRTEIKTGDKHTDFRVNSDPFMTPFEAALRRDFTINAMSMQIESGEIYDPFGGQMDIENGMLVHVSEKFSEDPLRVLRGMQFAARFDMQMPPATIKICSELSMKELSSERIFEEFNKMILQGCKISRGLDILFETTWLYNFPELSALVGVEQNPKWHAEGDVWNHTKNCMDEFAKMEQGEFSDYDWLVIGFAVLCHDFGKPHTTTTDEIGQIHHYGHELAGVEPTRTFLTRMTNSLDFVEDVVKLVSSHHKPVQMFINKARGKAFRRLANKVERLDMLCVVVECDQKGRDCETNRPMEMLEWFIEQAKLVGVEDAKPVPIMMGRHLVEIGFVPGKHFGPILNDCFELQLDGEIRTVDDGLDYIRRTYAEGNP